MKTSQNNRQNDINRVNNIKMIVVTVISCLCCLALQFYVLWLNSKPQSVLEAILSFTPTILVLCIAAFIGIMGDKDKVIAKKERQSQFLFDCCSELLSIIYKAKQRIESGKTAHEILEYRSKLEKILNIEPDEYIVSFFSNYEKTALNDALKILSKYDTGPEMDEKDPAISK